MPSTAYSAEKTSNRKSKPQTRSKKGMLHLFRAKANIDLYENIGPFFRTFYINSVSAALNYLTSVSVVYLIVEDKNDKNKAH